MQTVNTTSPIISTSHATWTLLLSALALGTVSASSIPLISTPSAWSFRVNVMTPAVTGYTLVAALSLLYSAMTSARILRRDYTNDLMQVVAWAAVSVLVFRWTFGWANIDMFVQLMVREHVAAAAHHLSMAACSYLMVAWGLACMAVHAHQLLKVPYPCSTPVLPKTPL
jgi:hypothetical protein